MANGRMIDTSMLQNEKVGELPMQARLLLIGMILLADDQGRVKANPSWLRSQVFTYDNIELDDVCQALCGLSNNDTIKVYEVDGKQYAQLNNWWKYQNLQYAQPSKFPKPQGWSDRVRYTFTKGVILTCNWVLGDGKATIDTCDESGKPLQKTAKANRNDSGDPTPESPKDLPNEQSSNQVNEQVNNQVNVQDKEEDQDQGGVGNTAHAREDAEPAQTAPPLEVAEAEQPFPSVTRITYAQVLDARAKVAREALPDEMIDPPSKAQASTPTEPTQGAAHVISFESGEKIFIQDPVWTGLVGAMLDGLGTRALADTGSVNGKAKRREAIFCLETLCKMSDKFRTVDGIKALFESWKKARPNDGAPLPPFLEEHASKYLSGSVRYPNQRNKVPTAPIIVAEPAEPKKFVPPYLRERKGFYTQ